MTNLHERSEMRTKAVWLCLLLSPALLLVNHFYHLWQLDQYKYFPALLLAVGLLFHARWDLSLVLPHNWSAWLLLVLGCGSTIIGSVYWSPWLGCLGFLFILGAFLNCCNVASDGRWGLLALWPASWLLLRLPLNLDFQLTSWLQSSTAKLSSHLLDRLEVTHRLTGNVFQMPGGKLFVEEACSGVQSLFALLFCAILWVVWQRRSYLLLPIYALLAIGCAGLMNILRVTAIALAQEWWQTDLAHGWPHELLGYACLLIAIGLLISGDRFLRVAFFPIPAETESQTSNPLNDWWNRWLVAMGNPNTSAKRATTPRPAFIPNWAFPIVAVLAPLVIVPQVVLGYAHWSSVPEYRKTDYWKPNAELLGQIPGLQVVEHRTTNDSSDPALGIHSDQWTCKTADGLVTRVLASQHAEVHDLCVCYAAGGWQLQSRQVVEANRSDGQGLWDVIEARFVNSETIFGELFFSTVDFQARPVRLRRTGLKDFLLQRIDKGDQPQQSGFDGQTLNIQVWTTSETPFTDEQRESLRQLQRQIRDIIRTDLANARR